MFSTSAYGFTPSWTPLNVNSFSIIIIFDLCVCSLYFYIYLTTGQPVALCMMFKGGGGLPTLTHPIFAYRRCWASDILNFKNQISSRSHPPYHPPYNHHCGQHCDWTYCFLFRSRNIESSLFSVVSPLATPTNFLKKSIFRS